MKNEYSLLNNVEIDFSQYIIEDVNEFEKKRMMKNFIKTKRKKVFWNKKKVLVSVVALILAVNLAIHGDKVLAAAASFKHDIHTWLGINTGGNYSAEIGKTLKGKNTKITLNEFFIGNSSIIINLNINKGQNDAIKNHLKLIPDVYIDGKKVERSSNYVGYSIGKIDEKDEESNAIFEVDSKDLALNSKNDVKLVFSSLAKECGVSDERFTYSFVYDSTNYKNASKVIRVDKNIIIDENRLSIGNVIVAPDRVFISGFTKGFSAWEFPKGANYYYDIVDENNNQLPLKEDIGKGAFFYRVDDNKNITTMKIIPYTYNKGDANTTAVSSIGREKYVFEDKVITIKLK